MGDPDRIFSLDEAPELSEALERHLDPEVESFLGFVAFMEFGFQL